MSEEYYYNGEYVTIFAEVTDNPDFVVVDNGDNILVARRSSLQKKEDTYQWQQQLKRKAELDELREKVDAELNKIADKVVDSALRALASRLKFNVMFGQGVNGGTAAWAIEVSNELEKLVKDKTKEKLKDKSIFD